MELRSLLDVHHHTEELFIVNHTVLVLVDLRDHFVDIFVSKRLVLRLHAHTQFFGADGSAVVFVEVLEGLLDLDLLRVVLGIHARGDELGVVDDTVVVGVDNLHGLLDVVDAHLDLRNLLDAIQQLLVGKLAVAILVDLGKGGSELTDLGFRNP